MESKIKQEKKNVKEENERKRKINMLKMVMVVEEEVEEDVLHRCR